MKYDCSEKELETTSRHLEISLNELLNRQNLRMAELLEAQQTVTQANHLRQI